MLPSSSRNCGARSAELRLIGSRTATSRSARANGEALVAGDEPAAQVFRLAALGFHDGLRSIRAPTTIVTG